MDSILTEQAFAEIIAANGGRVYRVGGCVRDKYLGLTPKDIDLCAVGMVKRNFKSIFPNAEEIGKTFPVFRLIIDGTKCEVAFARTERKVGSGHKGFKVSSSPKIKIEDDLYRRDLTVNSIAIDCLTGEIIDPYNGVKDIEAKVLRANGPHFIEDPVRALRLAGLSARLDFDIDKETLKLARKVAAELREEPVERTLTELRKVLMEARHPSRLFKVLAEIELLEITFPEIYELDIEVFNKAMLNLDAVSKYTSNPKLRFAAIGINFSQDQLSCWNKRMTLPGEWIDAAVTAGKVIETLKSPSSENLVISLYILNRGLLNAEEFDILTGALKLSLPELVILKRKIQSVSYDSAPKALKGRELGEWLRRKHVEVLESG